MKPVLALLLLALCLPLTAPQAQLQPDEVAIIAVRRSAASREIAEYYAQARGIPESHICLIDVEPGQHLDRNGWEFNVRPAIRDWVLSQQLEQQLRCFVTTWDVPLKIGRTSAEEIQSRQAYLAAERQHLTHRLIQQIDRLRQLLADRDDLSPTELDLDSDPEQLGQVLQAEIQSVNQRMAAAAKDDLRQARNDLQQVVLLCGGVRWATQIMLEQQNRQPEAQELEKRIESFQGRLLGLRDARSAMEEMPDSVERDKQLLALASLSDGLLGAVGWVDSELSLLDKNESYASFDSELSLLFWFRYPKNRWRVNPLHYRFDDTPHERQRRPTLMVSRLEAPTVELTKQLIDISIKTEEEGLVGNAYLDARGMRGPSPNETKRGSYGEFDQGLRDLATILEQHTEITVTLDNNDRLFQPGDCPDAALYCGWYSLARYVDAFTFSPGAVGYHMASSEASTLRDAESQVWCKRLLEEGVVATLGPAYEPYIVAFPRPDEFFVALLSGQYSLVECYYRTKPFNSWVMLLVGDPLYNPYGKNPALKRAALPESYQRILEP